MRVTPVLIALAAASAGMSGHAQAMGSGPHPNVPFGIPAPPSRISLNTSLDEPGSSAKPEMAQESAPFWFLWIVLLMPSLILISAKLLLWSRQGGREK